MYYYKWRSFMIKPRQLRSLLRDVSGFSIHNLAAFSAWSAANPRLPNFSTDEDDSGDSRSEVLRRAVTSRRPATVRWTPRLANSVQLIGSVERPVETLNTKNGGFGVFTTLRVKNPNGSKQLTYKIMLLAWEELAEICINHVKPGDFIYVSGILGFFDNKDDYGSQPKITAKELNFVDVSLYGSHPNARKADVSESEGLKQSDEQLVCSFVKLGQAEMQVYQNHLWQAFFSNPDRWRDERTSKKQQWSPDFVHKDSRERLRLRDDVPSWLQLLDSNKAEQKPRNGTHKNDLYLWQVFFHNPNEWWDNRRSKCMTEEDAHSVPPFAVTLQFSFFTVASHNSVIEALIVVHLVNDIQYITERTQRKGHQLVFLHPHILLLEDDEHFRSIFDSILVYDCTVLEIVAWASVPRCEVRVSLFSPSAGKHLVNIKPCSCM